MELLLQKEGKWRKVSSLQAIPAGQLAKVPCGTDWLSQPGVKEIYVHQPFSPAEIRDYGPDDRENENTALVVRLINPRFEWKLVWEMEFGRIY